MVKDLTGERFERLLVTGRAPSRKSSPYWNCICDCGNEREVLNYNLVIGKTRSCGCIKKKEKSISHTRIYSIWAHVKNRCLNSNNDRYSSYGGRGITICDKWLSFSGFYEDMKDGYSDDLSIDRIDNDKGYSKENCRWATDEQQAYNRRNTLMLTFNNKTKTLNEFAKMFNINKEALRGRIRRGWSIEEALTSPARKGITGLAYRKNREG